MVPRLFLLATLACALLLPAALALRLNRTAMEPVPPHDPTRLRSGLDQCWLRDRTLFVRGWAFLDGETGVRQVHVYATDAQGSVLRIPARVEPRPDLDEAAGRAMDHDAARDGFSAGSSRVVDLRGPVTVTLLRYDSDGRLHGATHACG